MANAGAVQDAKRHAAEIASKAKQGASNPWVEKLARFGYVVRGVLYIIIGLLALQVALGRGGETTTKNGAIATIGEQPFGKLLLVLVLVGLVGYSLWGLIRAFLDPLGRGTEPKGLAQRAGYLVSALTYGSLVLPTFRFIVGQPGNNQGGSGSQEFSAALLAQPFGPFLVGLLGLIGIIGGFGQIWGGVTSSFEKDLNEGLMSDKERQVALWAGRIGMVARGIIFALIGFFILQSALHVDPKQAKGVDGALQELARQPFGPLLLGGVALGLVFFGVFSVMCARWMKINTGQSSDTAKE